MSFRCLGTQDPDWQTILERSWRFDYYHLAGYHRLAERGGEGRARLLVLERRSDHIALPLLLRPVPGHEEAMDATSVYGYAGPVASRPKPPAALVAAFQEAVSDYLGQHGVVALFARLHPLIPQQEIVAGLGECPRIGATASIDLTLAEEARRRGYRANHRRDIRRLERLGVRCIHDEHWAHFDAFHRLYEQTLDRLGAADEYYFPASKLRALGRVRGGGAELFACLDRDEVVCAGIALRCRRTVGYHLSGTAERFVGQAPLKLLLDAIASWGAARGARRLHLGGGVGGHRDSLFHFKRGFSDRVHDFRVWRWIVAGAAYERLCRARGRAPDDRFFPAYRAGGDS